MVNRVEGNEMESPMTQWGWQVGRGVGTETPIDPPGSASSHGTGPG